MAILGAVVVFGLACGGGAGGSEAPTATRAVTPSPTATLTSAEETQTPAALALEDALRDLRATSRNLAQGHLAREGLDCVWILEEPALEVGAVFEKSLRLPHANLSYTEVLGQAFIDECEFLNP